MFHLNMTDYLEVSILVFSQKEISISESRE